MLIGTNTLPRYYLNYFTFPKMDNRFARQANDTSIPIKSSVRLALLLRFIYCINLCPRLLKNSPLPKWVEINSEVEAFSHRLYVNIYFLNYRKVTSSRPI